MKTMSMRNRMGVAFSLSTAAMIALAGCTSTPTVIPDEARDIGVLPSDGAARISDVHQEAGNLVVLVQNISAASDTYTAVAYTSAEYNNAYQSAPTVIEADSSSELVIPMPDNAQGQVSVLLNSERLGEAISAFQYVIQ